MNLNFAGIFQKLIELQGSYNKLETISASGQISVEGFNKPLTLTEIDTAMVQKQTIEVAVDKLCLALGIPTTVKE